MQSTLKLESIFQNHMLFQMNHPIRLFGLSYQKQQIVVQVNNENYSYSIDSGKFLVELPIIHDYKETFEITIESSAGDKIVITDCIFGDLFVASGQSNMQFTLKDGVYDEIIESDEIRFYEVPKLPYEDAHIEFPYFYFSNPKWSHCTKEEALKFSAIGYFVATGLYQNHKHPIGIISCNMGDTSVFSWIDLLSIKNNPELKPYLDYYQSEIDKYRSVDEYNERYHIQLPRLMEFYGQIDKGIKSGLPSDKAHEEAYKYYPDPYIPMGPKHYNRPGGCFEMMISKVIPLSVKGVLFYQGESDHQNCTLYEEALKTLVSSLRKNFLNDNLPFIYVQIANYSYPGARIDGIPMVRNAQNRIQNIDDNCLMVSAIDVGECENIHPKDKRVISQRLVQLIDEYIYHQGKNSLSPEIDNYKLLSDATLLITVKNNPLPLKSLSGKNLGFYGINNDNELMMIDNVVINSQSILIQNAKAYKEITYAYSNNPVIDIYSKNDLPLLPFRIIL